ncbi:GNAT family N-acetyltransferase [Rhodococcus gannanensis]|uniref:GNAT family N-acetyltransferase n=1 Tax=Rhodococcus gannanensis TaxID=1960308 RepID=A0ABW4PA69_9NOCA
MIRPANAVDLTYLPGIEVAAGEPFRTLGMTAVADDDPPTRAELEHALHAGRLWVATASGPTPVGYAIADVIDGCGHVEQVSVDPRWAGRRLGAALIDAIEEWARALGYDVLTLTTFAEVPWNAPYYGRLGFEPMADRDIGPELRAVRVREAAHGLDVWPRIAMRRRLRPATAG